MYITNLSIVNFRNYNKIELAFNDKLNFFIGNNAMGKTNILESIYYSSLTKSHRNFNEKDLIKFGCNFFKIDIKLFKDNKLNRVSLIQTNVGKKIIVNGTEQNKITDYFGFFNVILFSPEDLKLVKGSPSLRRKFFDIILSQISNEYLNSLSRFNHYLKQKNDFLKNADMSNDSHLLYLDTLDNDFLDDISYIYERRNELIHDFNILLGNIYNKFDDAYEIGYIKYAPQIDITSTYKEDIGLKLKNIRRQEFLRKTTLFGPHRDDYNFMFDNNLIKNYGSQGQIRTFVLFLKLSHLIYIKEKTNYNSLLLLDDVFSELDEKRKLFLIKSIPNDVQTFITGTDVEGVNLHLFDDYSLFNVNNGYIYKNN